MEKDPIFLVELKQSDIEGIISALDTVVKSHGLNVAEKCAEIHKLLLQGQPKVEPKLEPEPKVEEKLEEISLSGVEDELKQIIEVPKKKRSTRKKK
tara:strand:+ start:252 stop:539 length:288 start_codon:yes stop_codon:yes gene_type:complete